MITAEFFRKKGVLIGFSVRGHADYSDGDDVVCASVSSAVQLTCNLISESFKIEADINVLNDKINLMLTSSPNRENAVKVIDALKMHLELLAEDYEGTIKITFSEV